MDALLDYLKTLPRMKRATHHMYAYRITTSTSGTPIYGHHDGGESGSGERLARLLELSACEDTAVVVSRWYGGVKLGSDRWKRTSQVAKSALQRGGFIQGVKDEKNS